MTFLLTSCGTGSSGGDGSSSGTDIPAGTWVKQDPKAEAGEPEFRPYSGVAAGDGRVYYWGGGHKSYDGNDIDAYEIAGNEWKQLTEEENTNNVESWFGPDLSEEVENARSQFGHLWTRDWLRLSAQEKAGSAYNFFGRELNQEEIDAITKIARVKYSQGGGHEVDVLTPRGRPLSKHSYGQTAWWPGHGFCLLKQRLWCYDPAKGDADDAWKELAANPYGSSFNQAGNIHVWDLAYDPDKDTLVTFYAAGFRRSGAYVYNPDWESTDADPWQSRPGSYMRQDGSWSQVYSAYNPDSGKHIVYAGQQWHRVNVETGVAENMPQLRNHPDLAGKLEEGGYGPVIRSFSMEWAPELDKVLVAVRVEGKLQLWTFDPSKSGATAKKAWSRFRLEGKGPVTAHAKWDTLARDPVTGIYVFVAKEDENANQVPETWTFRLSKNQ